jgi:Xaa-Pro aminopeptidase
LFKVPEEEMFDLAKSLLGKSKKLNTLSQHRIGQPLHITHPHILKSAEEINYGITKSEFANRRDKLLKDLPNNSVVILPAAKHCYMTNDIPYRYKQNVDFQYLTGIHEPSSVAVIIKGNQGNQSKSQFIVFCRERNSERELWDGPCIGVDRVSQIFGADASYPLEKLEEMIGKLCSPGNPIYFHDIDTETSIGISLYSALQDLSIISIKENIQNLRVLKSEAEQDIIRVSCQISGEAFAATMSQTKNMKYEYQINALYEYECNKRGCKRLGYPPVVASGVSALTLHYIDNNDSLNHENNDLILMDAGGEYHDYTADITRTWPLTGKFTEPQQELYEAVLEVQQHCFKYAVPGSNLEMIYKEGVRKTISVLKRLGFHNYANYDKFNALFPHDTGHYLGMDVHDTPSVPKTKRFSPGFVITVEPGLYIPYSDDVPERFRGIGIRIEDDVLITHKDPEILTRSAPKTIQEIEHHCNQIIPISL